MPDLQIGQYQVRLAAGTNDVRAALRLRSCCFRNGADDEDAWDDRCQHFMVWAGGDLLATCRVLPLADGRAISESYAAQFYDLRALADYPDQMLELGRFCIASGAVDADVLRVLWAALARYVDQQKIACLFGCSSFAGTDDRRYPDAFQLLHQKHAAPMQWTPARKSASTVSFDVPDRAPLDRKAAIRQLPPLLKTYLGMGGWVSDHAVIDRDLNTLHVFTAVEIDKIPASRARALRLIAR